MGTSSGCLNIGRVGRDGSLVVRLLADVAIIASDHGSEIV